MEMSWLNTAKSNCSTTYLLADRGEFNTQWIDMQYRAALKELYLFSSVQGAIFLFFAGRTEEIKGNIDEVCFIKCVLFSQTSYFLGNE